MRAVSRAVAAVLIGACAAGVAGPAPAHEYDGNTAATAAYDSKDDEWRGRVASFVPACEQRRKVKLQELDGESWETVAKTRSKRSGRWRIAMKDAEGSFRVVVTPRSKVTIEHEHECRRFASGTVEVGR